MVKTLEDDFPGITSFENNPVIELIPLTVVKIPTLLMYRDMQFEDKKYNSKLDYWLIRKYNFSIECYIKVFNLIDSRLKSPIGNYSWYLNALTYLEQCISSLYQFRIKYENIKNDNKVLFIPSTSNKWECICNSYNIIKHYEESGNQTEFSQQTFIDIVGFHAKSHLVSYSDIATSIREVEELVKKILDE